MGIPVRATVIRREPKTDEQRVVAGYYAHQRRYEGDEFEIEKDTDFSERWMERCAPASDPPATTESFGQRMKAAREHKAAMKSAIPTGG